MIEVSKFAAEDKVLATQNVQKFKLGSIFNFGVAYSCDGRFMFTSDNCEYGKKKESK